MTDRVQRRMAEVEREAGGSMRVVIVGAGRGGMAMLEVLHIDDNIEIVAMIDGDDNAPGLALARQQGIATASTLDGLGGYDLLINVTGSKEVSRTARQLLPEGAELIEGASARFFYDQLMKRKQEHAHVQNMLMELAHLNSLGQRLNASNSLDAMLTMVVQEAMSLMDMPAASVSLYDAEKQLLSLAVSSGFSEVFDQQLPWQVREGGLTERILCSRKPFAVDDVNDPETPFNCNGLLAEEGVKSLVAVPLVLDDTTVGILYVDDFKPRRFNQEQLRLLSLLGGQAAHSIEKERMISELRQSQQAMATLNEELETRIMTRTRDLRVANEELVRASQAKSQFISNMSH
ncbi:MAG: GAF domain-containing protein, partial [Mariprofundales bacterium]|nr:GAF domain-containing protein [Mariprofundales bacterium]